MPRRDLKRECREARCDNYLECMTKWGHDCRLLGGTRIPRMEAGVPIYETEQRMIFTLTNEGSPMARRNLGDLRYG